MFLLSLLKGLKEYFYGSMFENYKKLLAYLYEENFETVTETEILAPFDDV